MTKFLFAVLRRVARSESIALCIVQQAHEQARGVCFEAISSSLIVALELESALDPT